MKLLKRLLNNKIVGISSSGGHLTELQSSIPQIFIKKVIYLTSKDGHHLMKCQLFYYLIIFSTASFKEIVLVSILSIEYFDAINLYASIFFKYFLLNLELEFIQHQKRENLCINILIFL